jgi:hypothetical protein
VARGDFATVGYSATGPVERLKRNYGVRRQAKRDAAFPSAQKRHLNRESTWSSPSPPLEERAGERRSLSLCGHSVHGEPRRLRNVHCDHEPHPQTSAGDRPPTRRSRSSRPHSPATAHHLILPRITTNPANPPTSNTQTPSTPLLAYRGRKKSEAAATAGPAKLPKPIAAS